MTFTDELIQRSRMLVARFNAQAFGFGMGVPRHPFSEYLNRHNFFDVRVLEYLSTSRQRRSGREAGRWQA
jgi:hypothetical protein